MDPQISTIVIDLILKQHTKEPETFKQSFNIKMAKKPKDGECAGQNK